MPFSLFLHRLRFFSQQIQNNAQQLLKQLFLVWKARARGGAFGEPSGFAVGTSRGCLRLGGYPFFGLISRSFFFAKNAFWEQTWLQNGVKIDSESNLRCNFYIFQGTLILNDPPLILVCVFRVTLPMKRTRNHEKTWLWNNTENHTCKTLVFLRKCTNTESKMTPNMWGDIGENHTRVPRVAYFDFKLKKVVPLSSKSDPKGRKTVSKRILNSHKSAKGWHKGYETQHFSMTQRTEPAMG